jgi:hypothetical protein
MGYKNSVMGVSGLLRNVYSIFFYLLNKIKIMNLFLWILLQNINIYSLYNIVLHYIILFLFFYLNNFNVVL